MFWPAASTSASGLVRNGGFRTKWRETPFLRIPAVLFERFPGDLHFAEIVALPENP